MTESKIVKFQPDEQNPIFFTDTAIEITKKVISEQGENGDGVRVSVIGGGCSGFQYSLDFEKEARESDIIMNSQGLTIYIDPISAQYLTGTVIDYVSDENGAGFKFDNPNPPKRSCSGCHGCD